MLSPFVPFLQFLAGANGRFVRILIGIVLIAAGLFMTEGLLSSIIILLGLLPVVEAAIDVSFISFIVGGPLVGEEIRKLDTKRLIPG